LVNFVRNELWPSSGPAFCFGPSYSFHLPFPSDIGFKLGNEGKYPHNELTCSTAGINGTVIQYLEGNPFGCKLSNNLVEIGCRAG